MPNGRTGQGLIFYPFDQLCLERPRGSKRRHSSKREAMGFCQPPNWVLTQPKELCDLRQLQPSIRTAHHPKLFIVFYIRSSCAFRVSFSGPSAGLDWRQAGPGGFTWQQVTRIICATFHWARILESLGISRLFFDIWITNLPPWCETSRPFHLLLVSGLLDGYLGILTVIVTSSKMVKEVFESILTHCSGMRKAFRR